METMQGPVQNFIFFYPGWSRVTIILSQTVQYDQGKKQTVHAIHKNESVLVRAKNFPYNTLSKKNNGIKVTPHFYPG
jgi:hypothetical protein